MMVFSVSSPPWLLMYSFAGFFKNLILCMTKLRFGFWCCVFLTLQIPLIGLFLYEDFWNMIFWLVLKLEISYTVMISWRIFGFFLETFLKIIFLHGEIFEFPQFFFLPSEFFWCKWQGHNVTQPLLYIQQSVKGMHILASTMCKMITYYFMVAKPWFLIDVTLA
jgi:hypothetical protein